LKNKSGEPFFLVFGRPGHLKPKIETKKSGEPFLIVFRKPETRKPTKQKIRRAIFDSLRETGKPETKKTKNPGSHF